MLKSPLTSVLNAKFSYPYEVNGKLVTGNGSLIPICSLSNRSFIAKFDCINEIITAGVLSIFGVPFLIEIILQLL
jgi:hypothetical protein